VAPLSALGPSGPRSVGFQDHSPVNARLSGGNQTVHLSSISAPPIQEQPPDLIVAIGAPAARLDIDDRNDITMLRCGVSDHDAASPPRCYFRLAPARIGCISRATHSHASTGFGPFLARTLTDTRINEALCRPHPQTREDAGADLCSRPAAKSLFRQARPVLRLRHPENSVSRLPLCELSA
jgi:hypothetical protein